MGRGDSERGERGREAPRGSWCGRGGQTGRPRTPLRPPPSPPAPATGALRLPFSRPTSFLPCLAAFAPRLCFLSLTSSSADKREN